MGWKSNTSSNTKKLWNLSLNKDDTNPTSAGKERRSIKRHSRGKHVEVTYRDLGFGLRKFQNSIELKAYKFLIPGAKIISHKHRETRLVHTEEGVKLCRGESGAECGGLSWSYWRSGLEWKAIVCDERGKKRSRESRGEQSWLPKSGALSLFFFLSLLRKSPLVAKGRRWSYSHADGWMDGWSPSFSNERNFSLMFYFWLMFWHSDGVWPYLRALPTPHSILVDALDSIFGWFFAAYS